MPDVRPALEVLLERILLPRDSDALLLKWTLERNPKEHYERWLDNVGDPVVGATGRRQGRRNIFPMMGEALRQAGLSQPESFSNLLRAAEIHESFRSERWEALALQAAEIIAPSCGRALHVAGSSVGRRYPRQSLRHHGLCQFAFETSAARGTAVAALLRERYAMAALPVRGTVPGIRLRHETGFVVSLQVGFPALGGDNQSLFDLTYDAGTDWCGGQIRIPAVWGDLIERIGRATYDFHRYDLDWLVDCYFLCRSFGAPDVRALERAADLFGLSRLTRSVVRLLREIDPEIFQFSIDGCQFQTCGDLELTFPEALLLWLGQRGPYGYRGRRGLLAACSHPSIWLVAARAYFARPDVRTWVEGQEWS